AFVHSLLVVAATGAMQPEAIAQARWEAGVGAAAVYLPDYRGSDEGSAYLLPFPYFTYTSERLRIDRSGIVARIFDSDRVELDASFTGGIALRSSGNRARAGMPSLHPTGEAGPEMVVRLVGERDGREPRLDL